jgi:hypothetical protein
MRIKAKAEAKTSEEARIAEVEMAFKAKVKAWLLQQRVVWLPRKVSRENRMLESWQNQHTCSCS